MNNSELPVYFLAFEFVHVLLDWDIIMVMVDIDIIMIMIVGIQQLEETCCHSNSRGKPSADAEVENDKIYWAWIVISITSFMHLEFVEKKKM